MNNKLGNRLDASRFLVGTPPLTLVPGLLASLDLIDGVGGVPAVRSPSHHLLAPFRQTSPFSVLVLLVSSSVFLALLPSSVLHVRCRLGGFRFSLSQFVSA